MSVCTGSELSLHETMEDLEQLSIEVGFTPDELMALLTLDLEIEHVLAYLEAAAMKQMN
jgi:hypothetical protein